MNIRANKTNDTGYDLNLPQFNIDGLFLPGNGTDSDSNSEP